MNRILYRVNETRIVPLVAKALTPVSQTYPGGGQNTIIYTQAENVVTDDGAVARVPVLSANSARHRIRQILAEKAIEASGVRGGEIGINVVQLLFQGGQVADSKNKHELTREELQELRDCLPAITLLGGNPGGVFLEGQVSVSPWYALCEEREPKNLRLGHEEFFARHLPDTRPPAESLISMVHGVAKGTARIDGEEIQVGESLPFSYECVVSGTVFFGWVEVGEQVTQGERDALAWALRELYHDRVIVLGAHDAAAQGRLATAVDMEALAAIGDADAFQDRMSQPETRERIANLLLRGGERLAPKGARQSKKESKAKSATQAAAEETDADEDEEA